MCCQLGFSKNNLAWAVVRYVIASIIVTQELLKWATSSNCLLSAKTYEIKATHLKTIVTVFQEEGRLLQFYSVPQTPVIAVSNFSEQDLLCRSVFCFTTPHHTSPTMFPENGASDFGHKREKKILVVNLGEFQRGWVCSLNKHVMNHLITWQIPVSVFQHFAVKMLDKYRAQLNGTESVPERYRPLHVTTSGSKWALTLKKKKRSSVGDC